MNTKYQTKSCKVKNAKIWQTLILHNCLPLGEHARFTSKNVAQYLLGSRNDYNLFKFNEIRHLLLKFTPLIETLFRSKVVLGYKVGSVRKVRYCKPVPPNDPSRYQEWYAKMKNVKIAKHHIAYYYKTLENKRPVKILFASTNPTYTDIIKTSAGICQMNSSTNRWLCGYITANSQSLGKQLKVSKELNTFTGKSIIERQFEKTFSENKEAKEKRYNWHNLNMLTQRPALAIIPDVANNDMILRETTAKTIPVIGLVNSDESTRIAYPIFGNSDSVQIVHFFCNFLAVLIAKTFVQVEYKQSSHRIFNRTRAFVNNLSKKTKATSVDAKSKSKILAQTKTFPWIKKRLRFKKRPKIKLKYSKNATRQATKKSLYNLAKYQGKKVRKLRLLRKNTNSTQIKIQNYNKLKYVGQQPYWKNLKTMMYLLAKDKYPRKYSSKWYRLKRQTKREEQKKLRNPNVESKTITSENVGEMIKAKQEKLSIRAVKRYENILMKRFTVKLHKLLKDKKISLSFKKAEKRVVLKNIKNSSNKIAKLKKRVIGNSRARRPKFFKKGYLWKLAKKNKRKALIKVYGHSHLIDRSKRNRSQWYAKFQTRKKRKFQLWKRKRIFAKEIKRIPLETREERVTKILEAIVELKITHTTAVQKNKVFQKLYMALKNKKIKAKNMKNRYERKKRSKFAKSIWRSPRLFKAMVKKYPYYTLLARNLFSERRPSLSKTAFKVLSYELTNKKSNPYAFSLKNLHRKQKISNSILWQKLYYKNWIIKWKKKRFVQIPKKHVFFITSKIKKRGLIGPSRTTNMYYFRKKLHLSNSRNFPTYIKRIRKSFNRHLLKSSQTRTKSVKFYRRRTRRFVYKFRRFHQILPSLAYRFKPYRKNYRRRYKRKNVKNKFIAKNKQHVNKKKVLKKKQPLFWKNKKINRSKRRFVFVPNKYKGKNFFKQTKHVSNLMSKETKNNVGKNFEKNVKGKKNKVSNIINVSNKVNNKKSSFTQNTNTKGQLRKKETFVANKEAKSAQNFTNVKVKKEATKLKSQAKNIKASSTKRNSSNDKKQKYINKKNNDKK